MFSSRLRVVSALLLLVAVQLPDREVVRRCLKEFCAVLSIQEKTVKFRESENFVPPYEVGPYAGEAQKWVPQNEAPIREMITPNRWRAIVSAALDEYDETGPTMRLRIFDQNGVQQLKYDGNYFLDDIESGMLFGTSDVVLSIQTGGKSAYVQDGEIWLLPESGKPMELLHVHGSLVRFQPNGSGTNGLPGVWVERETYDGIHADTKGTELQFWRWDSGKKDLTQLPKVDWIVPRISATVR